MAVYAGELDAHDAACSLAASAGVNATNALLIQIGVKPPNGSDHYSAVTALRQRGQREASVQLASLLGLKHRSQYETSRCTAADADRAIKLAERIVNKSKGM